MIAVDLADGICSTIGKKIVQKLYFLFPIPMRAMLAIRKHERFAGIKTAIDSGEIGICCRDIEDAGETEKIEGGPAGFKDQAMG
jgi:hypothetical protein